MDISSTIAGGAIGIMDNMINQSNANANAVKSLEMSKDLSQFNHNLQLDLFNKTGYDASVKQMQKAGLNTALMYGGAGGGGSTASSGGSMNIETKDSK